MPSTVRIIRSPAVIVRVIRNDVVTRVIKEPSTRVVRVIAEGPQGPAGPPGAGASETTFSFLSPASVWTVAHNLGRRPKADVLTLGGTIMTAEVTHLSTNTLQVTFDQPTAGAVSLY